MRPRATSNRRGRSQAVAAAVAARRTAHRAWSSSPQQLAASSDCRQLYRVVEACLKAAGSRLSAQAEREFAAFDHLASGGGGKLLTVPAPIEPPLPTTAPLPTDNDPATKQTGSWLTARIAASSAELGGLLSERKASLERRWADAKALEDAQWQQERRLLSLCCHLLFVGGFQLYSQQQADQHKEMTSTSGVGVRVNWNSVDTAMLTRFDPYKSLGFAGTAEPPKELASRVLLAHR